MPRFFRQLTGCEIGESEAKAVSNDELGFDRLSNWTIGRQYM